MHESKTWRQRAFSWVMVACLQFLVLSAVAMTLYPGGTVADPMAPRYSFFQNFFSDLGRSVSPRGQPNTAAAILFAIALAVAGAGLALFFVASPGLFAHPCWGRLLSRLGSAFGVLSGLCFVGIALTPADLLLEAHRWFVLTAFRAFLPAVICYTLAVLADARYPGGFALVYLGFAALLAAYLALLIQGPAPDTSRGLVIQATGQKVIAYAAIVCIFIQAWGAREVARAAGQAPVPAEAGR